MQSFIERFECARGDIVVSKWANIAKKANAGNKKRKATENRKGPANATRFLVKSMVFPVEPQTLVTDILCIAKCIATPNQPPQDETPNTYKLSILKFCHRKVSNC